MKLAFSSRQKIILLVLCAILFRLLVMPFFMHMDLLSEFRRINYASEHGSYYPGFNRLTVFYIESLFYMVTKWFVVNPELVLYLPDPRHSTAEITTHFVFTGDPHVFRHLFLFKLPYLVFDLLSALLIWRYFRGHRLQTAALALWLFNPVTLYSSYFFGRFEVISLFFLIWTALCLQQRKLILAACVFGLALNCREINLIFAPAFALVLFSAWRSRSTDLRTAVVAVLIVIFFVRLPYIIEWLFNAEALFTKESGVLDVANGMSAFFAPKFAYIYPFFLLAALCYFALLSAKNLPPEELFVAGCLSVILPFFIADFRSAHYFSWAVPFLILAMVHTRNLVLPVCVLFVFWVAYWLLNPFGAHFTPLLITPVHEAYFGFDNFLRFYRRTVSNGPVFGPTAMKDLFLTFTAACILIILYRVHHRESGTAISGIK